MSRAAHSPTRGFDTVAIIGKHGDSGAGAALLELAAFLEKRGHRLVADTITAQYVERRPDDDGRNRQQR